MNSKDYKNEFLNCLAEFKEVSMEENIPYVSEAVEIVEKFIKQRYDNELKSYNYDPVKSNDEFIARKNMEYLNLYVEELFLLDKTVTDHNKTELFSIRKQMRYIVHEFWRIINEE